MKLKLKKRIVVLYLLLILFILILINYPYLSDSLNNLLKSGVGSFGYYGIVLFVFLLEFLPQPFLSALVLLTLGLFFKMNYIYLISLIVFSAVFANYSAYFVGRKYGESVTTFFISRKNYDKSVRWFEKYGKVGITILALTPLPYFPVMGGIFEMTFWEFTFYAIVPRIFHLLIFSYLILRFI